MIQMYKAVIRAQGRGPVVGNVLLPGCQCSLAAVRQAAGPAMARQIGEMLGADLCAMVDDELKVGIALATRKSEVIKPTKDVHWNISGET
ncbi:hypothetical protein [Streptomyces sp. NPDC054874]